MSVNEEDESYPMCPVKKCIDVLPDRLHFNGVRTVTKRCVYHLFVRTCGCRIGPYNKNYRKLENAFETKRRK